MLNKEVYIPRDADASEIPFCTVRLQGEGDTMSLNLLRIIHKRWIWMRHTPALDAMTSMEEFRDLMERVQEPIFIDYEKNDQIARRDFCMALDSLNIDLSGKKTLDIGPGYGSALNISRERGASHVEFVDFSPFMYTFNRLKGFTGFRVDVRRNLKRLAHGRYDLIWIKGTYSADRFILRNRTGIMHPLHRYPRLDHILIQLKDLAAPGGEIIFCPHWISSNRIRSIPDVRNTSLTRTFLNNGYAILPFIEGHNEEPQYPITFYRKG